MFRETRDDDDEEEEEEEEDEMKKIAARERRVKVRKRIGTEHLEEAIAVLLCLGAMLFSTSLSLRSLKHCQFLYSSIPHSDLRHPTK